MALIQFENLSEDDDHLDNRRNVIVFSDNLFSTIADHLLEDWVSVLMQLGLEYRHVTSIEKKYPNDLSRQALAGLMQWKKTVERTDVGMNDAVNKLLTAFDEKGRQDIIDVVEKFRENTENQNLRKRCLTVYGSHSHSKRKTLRRISGNAVYQAAEEMIEYESTFKDEEVPSTSTEHNHFHHEGDVSKSAEHFHANGKLNNEVITVLVDHKSSFIPFGRHVRKRRIAMLLSTGSNYTKASAFGKHADFIDKHMTNGMVYRISGYKLKTSDYSNPDLEMTLFKSTDIQVVPTSEIPKQVKRNFRIDDIKQKCHVRHLKTVGPVVVTSVGGRRRPSVKYLKEVKLKDYSGTIIMRMWSLDKNVSFAYRRGDVLELQNVEVGMFKSYSGIEYHLTGGDVVNFVQIPGYDMQDLLIDEEEHFLTPITVKVNDLEDMKEPKHLVYLNFVTIEVFVKNSQKQTIFMHCDIDQTHGILSDREDGLYCDECEDYTEGEKKAKLTAEVVDAYDHSTNSVWVNLYDKSVQTVLGDSYKAFIETKKEKKRASILRKCELQNKVFRLELKFDPKYSTQSVKKLTII